MTKYIIVEEQLVSLVNYLMQKPFGEVYQLIGMLQALQELKEEPVTVRGKKAL